jgi:SlyX protein
MSLSDIESRLMRIETKLSFAEDLLEELNRLAFRQQAHIERLEAMIKLLSERAEQNPAQPGTRDPRDDIPPHY